IGIAQTPPIFDTHVSAVGPASFLQALDEGIAPDLPFRIVRSQVAREHAYASHSLALLRARRERPRRRAAEQCDKRAAVQFVELHPILTNRAHSSKSSARINRDSGISIPSALATCRLTSNSILVGCSTGRSAGGAPLRIRST